MTIDGMGEHMGDSGPVPSGARADSPKGNTVPRPEFAKAVEAMRECLWPDVNRPSYGSLERMLRAALQSLGVSVPSGEGERQ